VAMEQAHQTLENVRGLAAVLLARRAALLSAATRLLATASWFASRSAAAGGFAPTSRLAAALLATASTVYTEHAIEQVVTKALGRHACANH
jgi:hypothetical protein